MSNTRLNFRFYYCGMGEISNFRQYSKHMKAIFTLVFALSCSIALRAQSKKHEVPAGKQELPVLGDSSVAPVVTHHIILLHGKPFHYTATTGYLTMKNKQGKVLAHLFFIAYTKDGVQDIKDRPISFAFNGGPGSSSIWLHMGALGPKRVVLSPKGVAPAPPYQLMDNQNTWLDKTDLVFIDPVSTGYSRPAQGQDAGQFHGYNEDIQSVGDFIRLFTTRYNRWSSPKFLVGESYGTTRAAGLSGYLQERYSMYLNGIVLISSVLNFQTITFSPENDLPFELFLPTYASTAWYYHRLSPDLQALTVAQLIRKVETFSESEYARVLFEGQSTDSSDVQDVLEKLHRYTSLPLDYLKESRLRVTDSHFFKELLRDSSMVIGRYDSRFSGEAEHPESEFASYDPSDKNLDGVFVATFNSYVRNELNYKNDLVYEPLANVWPWDYRNVENRFLDVSSTLHHAMIINPYLHVWVCCGYFDLATPVFSAEYTIHHMGLSPSQRRRLQFTYYKAGHMVYISQNTEDKLHRDADAFYNMVLNGR